MIKYIFLLLACCVVHRHVAAQQYRIRVPQVNLKKLSKITSNKSRIIKYYKMMRRDSVRRERRYKRSFRNMVDSTVRANRGHTVGLYDSSLLKHRLSRIALDSLSYQSPIGHLPMKMDTATAEGIINTNHLGKVLGEDTQIPHASILSNEFTPDSISGRVHSFLDDYLPSERLNVAEQIPSVTAIDAENLPEKTASSIPILAQDHFARHGDKIVNAQQTISKLVRRYRAFRNSDNLDGAMKRNSLSDKSLSERLVFNAMANATSVSPICMDISVLGGYRVTRSLSTGLGINVRFSGSDSIPSTHYISSRHVGTKAYTSYDVLHDFFLYAEWERVSQISRIAEDVVKRATNNIMIGIGRKFRVHPMVYVTLLGVYNLNPDDENPIHPRRFQIRSGFQLSELAMRKKAINYDPNR